MSLDMAGNTCRSRTFVYGPCGACNPASASQHSPLGRVFAGRHELLLNDWLKNNTIKFKFYSVLLGLFLRVALFALVLGGSLGSLGSQ